MPGCRINPPKRNVFSTIFCTCAKNIQLQLQRQRPADSDAFVPKHLSLSPATAVGVISAATVQSLCSLTASVLHDKKIRLHALVHSQARQTDIPDLLCTLCLGSDYWTVRWHRADCTRRMTNLSRCFLEGTDDRVISTSSPLPSGVGVVTPAFDKIPVQPMP